MIDGVLLRVVGLVFALVSGLNDGATLIAINLPNPAYRPLVSIAILVGAIVVVPLAFGTLVARTLARGLVAFEGQAGERPFLLAVVVALVVMLVLSRRGLPTSLTLALVGAVVGIGLGAGLPVSWTAVGAVIGVAAVCPVASAAAGLLAMRSLGRLRLRRSAPAQLRLLGAPVFLLQAIAYAANDGQKMIAVWALADTLGGDRPLAADLPSQLLLGLVFAIGTLLGVERLAARLGRGVLPVRPLHSIAAELGSAGSVLASAALGAPVSTTQSSTAALIGAGVGDARWRIRWEQAARVAGAWLVTLPSATLCAAVVATLVERPR